MDWQPIETAPLNKKILICWGNGDCAVVTQSDLEGFEGFYLAYVCDDRLERPTHWMPLPEPPADTKKGRPHKQTTPGTLREWFNG